MKRIYADNAATSFPKPEAVTEAMQVYACTIGASAGRGAYAEARQAEDIIRKCRKSLAQLFNAESPEQIIFTLNATDALNLAIKGLIGDKTGSHIITTWMDHNSILRPFNALVNRGLVEQTRVQCDPATGLVDPDDIAKAIRSNTKLIATLHGSNVTGTLQPVDEIGRICHKHEIPFVLDAAQSVGHIPLDVQKTHIDYLAFPGHKGLLGPLGTGGLYIAPGMETQLQPLREGGTGSVSELDTQPENLPDRFEPGSHNTIGIAGLLASVDWILDQNVAQLRIHEITLITTMLNHMNNAPSNLHMFGPTNPNDRFAVFSFQIDGLAPAELATILEDQYGILTRPGLHCAPLAHKTIGTFDTGGTTRMSFGPFTQTSDITFAANALIEIASQIAGITTSKSVAANRC